MEVMGGVMIMLILLALLFSAVWLSLPILLLGLWRSVERLELRITTFEHRLDRIQESLQADSGTTKTDFSTETASGGVDGTA